MFPMEQFNEDVPPAWFHIGGELRERAESYQGIGFKNSRDTHDLQRFRLNAAVDAGKWLHLFAEVQDARIFLNGPVASTNNVQDTWTLWQSYVQIGSTSHSRRIGPSAWRKKGSGSPPRMTMRTTVQDPSSRPRALARAATSPTSSTSSTK
jgi:hypothetical protein